MPLFSVVFILPFITLNTCFTHIQMGVLLPVIEGKTLAFHFYHIGVFHPYCRTPNGNILYTVYFILFLCAFLVQ